VTVAIGTTGAIGGALIEVLLSRSLYLTVLAGGRNGDKTVPDGASPPTST
jgi:hypothetical protein